MGGTSFFSMTRISLSNVSVSIASEPHTCTTIGTKEDISKKMYLILGSLESGVDFEKRVHEIYQNCRTAKEIDDAFNRLQEELDESY